MIWKEHSKIVKIEIRVRKWLIMLVKICIWIIPVVVK